MAARDPLIPGQERMCDGPGTAPYSHLFGGATAARLQPEIGSFIALASKQRMATYRWAPLSNTNDNDAPAKGVFVLVHGFAEHLGRWNHVANYLAQHGFEVCGIDYTAHGLSQGFAGARGYIRSVDELAENLSAYVLTEIASKKPGPHFVYSHSTGGMVAFLALDRGLAAAWHNLKAVIYSAPLLRQPSAIAQPLYCCPRCAICVLSCGLACGTCCSVPGVKPGELTSYSPAEAATRADPLYFGWTANFSVVRALLAGTVEAQQKLDQPTYPFLILQSPNDRLVDAKTAKLLYEKAPSSLKDFQSSVFAGLEHELHNEEEWWRPLEIVKSWVERHSLVATAASGGNPP